MVKKEGTDDNNRNYTLNTFWAYSSSCFEDNTMTPLQKLIIFIPPSTHYFPNKLYKKSTNEFTHIGELFIA